jgi:CheY-like chemotaxis protein
MDHGFDVVFCDLMMPDMSGVEFYAELERTAPQLVERVVFLTGGAFTPASRQFLARVPNPRLHKPFDAKVLRATVADLLNAPAVTARRTEA